MAMGGQETWANGVVQKPKRDWLPRLLPTCLVMRQEVAGAYDDMRVHRVHPSDTPVHTPSKPPSPR